MIDEELDVLLVEDNSGDARLIEIELGDVQVGTFDLEWVQTLKDGLSAAVDTPPDAIFLDLNLPDSTGLDTVQQMHDQVPGIPIVVLTGLEDEEMGMQAVREGAQDYLVKGDVDGPRLARTLTYAVERQRAQQELEELRRQIAMNDKLAALGALVSGLAREIRSSTTQITNALYQIRQRVEQTAGADPALADLVEDVAEFNASALDGVSRVDELVRDLRQFTQTGPQGRERVSIDDPVRDAAELFRKTHQSALNLLVELGGTPRIEVNATQVKQIVVNLLRNAADAMPKGGSVAVRTRTEDGHVVVEIEDDGEGMTRYVQRRLFEPFFTTRENADGLGLAIAKRVVEAHGGEIDFESEKGEGTTFWLRFPTEQSVEPGG